MTHTYIYIYMYICIYVYIYIYMFVCLFVCLSLHRLSDLRHDSLYLSYTSQVYASIYSDVRIQVKSFRREHPCGGHLWIRAPRLLRGNGSGTQFHARTAAEMPSMSD